MAVSEKLKLNSAQGIRWLMLCLYFAVGALAQFQSDTGWMIRAGEQIWLRKEFPRLDAFSFALPPGTIWTNHQAVSGLLFYLLYRAGGVTLIAIFIGVMFALAGAVLASMVEAEGIELLFLLGLPLPGVIAASSMRAQAFAVLAFPLLIYFALYSDRLPAIFLVLWSWANMHASAVYGLVVLGCSAAADFVLERRFARPVLLISLALLALSLTPLGLHQIPYTFLLTAKNKAIRQAEFMPPAFFTALGLSILVAAVSAAAYARRALNSPQRRRTLTLGLMVLISFGAAIYARRAAVFLGMSAAMFCGVNSFTRRSAAKEQEPATFGNFAVCLCFTGLSLLAVAGLRAGHWARLNLDPISPAVVSLVDHCRGPVFNSLDSGGYLLFARPDRKIFIDNRVDPYSDQLLVRTINAEVAGDWAPLEAQFGFSCALIERTSALAERLQAAGWMIKAQDPIYLLLEKPPGTAN